MPKVAPTPHLSNPHGVSRAGALAPGARVDGGNYVLKRMLGRGGFSEVWLAWDRKLEQDVALKFLPQTLLENAAVLEHLASEIARSQRLAHPAIARVYGLIQDSENVAIATEYVEGWSLGTLKVDRPQKCYQVEEIAPWVGQICAALEYAHHEIGLVHRDLKPANVLFDAREQVKLTDFAVAHTVRTALAQQGHLVYGAIAYMSPQQLKGAEASLLDDLYSLGATIYDLLTGTPPFHRGEIMVQVCELVPDSMVERLRQLEIEAPIPRVWEEAVAACLAKEPAARPQSAGELWKWLGTGQAPKHVTPKPAPNGEPKSTQTSTRWEIAGNNRTTADRAGGTPALLPGERPALFSELEPAETDENGQLLEPGVQLTFGRRTMAFVLAGVMLLAIVVGLTGAWWLHSSKATRGNSKMTGPPGSFDAGFDAAPGADNEIRDLMVQADGHILIGGNFANFDGVAMKGIGQLNADGRPATNFSASINGAVHAIAIQSDGKILVGGDFMKVNDHSRRRIARLNTDGSLDTSFDPRGALNREVRTIVVQPDGKILAGGSFDASSGHHQNRITRFNADGRRDTTFTPAGGANGGVWAIALLPDGKILVGGDFTRFNGSPQTRITRLNPDGTIDSTFSCSSGANASVLAFCLQPDGKILLAGNFTNVAGLDRTRIARMHPDGSVDSTFKPADIPKGSLRSLALQPDGKILIAGVLETVQGRPRNGIARLNSDGTLDTLFDPGGGAMDGSLWRVAPTPQGKWLIAGVFQKFNGAACGRIAMLNGDPIRSSRN